MMNIDIIIMNEVRQILRFCLILVAMYGAGSLFVYLTDFPLAQRIGFAVQDCAIFGGIVYIIGLFLLIFAFVVAKIGNVLDSLFFCGGGLWM